MTQQPEKPLANPLKGNPALFIPIPELPHYVTGLNDKQTQELKEAIDVLREDNVFFLGELALMPSPLYAPDGFFKKTINPLNSNTASTAPQYSIPKNALKIIDDLMKKNGFSYGSAVSNTQNAWYELKEIKKQKHGAGIRRYDAVRNFLMDNFGDESLNKGLKSAAPPSLHHKKITLKFNLSSEHESVLQDKNNLKRLAEYTNYPVKIRITRAFLTALKSPIPTDEMYANYFPPDENKITFEHPTKNTLKVHITLPALFAGMAQDNLERYPKKFDEIKENIGQELALSINSIQKVHRLS